MVGLHKCATKVDKGANYCALQHRTKIKAGREMGREEEGNDVFIFGGGCGEEGYYSVSYLSMMSLVAASRRSV